jgi:glycerol-3-phosphate dehydrogenase
VPAPIRLVQGSHVVVRKLYDHDAAYIFQNADGRIFFLIPYERDFTLIGTTDQDYTGDPSDVRIDRGEIDYLCRSTAEYLRQPVTQDQVAWSYSGVRPLFDDGSSAPEQATRDYVLKLDASGDAPALLTVFGGKITTYRRLGETALSMLQPHLPPVARQKPGWTGRMPLPGGDFPMQGFEALVASAAERYPFMPPATLRRLFRAYGTRADAIIGDATGFAGLGPVLGADLTEAELRYLVAAEWARTAEDVVWRRSKLGLRLTPAEIATIDTTMRRLIEDGPTAA